jgi:RES domain
VTNLPSTISIDQRNTHRLIPAQYADGGETVLARLTNNNKTLDAIIELDNATNDRLWAESGKRLGIDQRELVFGIPSYRVINAAYCHPQPAGARFNSPERGAWYAGFALKTSQAEAGYHRRLWLEETKWEEREAADYANFVADFHAVFHDIRKDKDFADCLSPDSYRASQELAGRLLEAGASGVAYPSVRHRGGTCIACFRPVLVTNVRRGKIYRCVVEGRAVTWEE